MYHIAICIMKRFFVWVLMNIAGAYGLCHAQLTVQQVDSMISGYLEDVGLRSGYCLYAYGNAIEKEVGIPVFNDTIFAQDVFVYFVDEHPWANWSHAARFLFVSEDGTIEERKTVWPPDGLEKWRCLSDSPELAGGSLYDFSKLRSRKASGVDMSHCHAVIISGGVEPSMNRARYWNDCAAVYSVLVGVYGYAPENIHVLVSDGTSSGEDRDLGGGRFDSSPLDLDGNGTPDIQYAATKSNVTKVFDILSRTLTEEDNLFMFVTDHGSIGTGLYEQNTQYINLWNKERMSDVELKAELDKLEVEFANVLLAQCYSGGVAMDLRAENRFIAAACGPFENSSASIEGDYEEFVYHWVAAVSGNYPSGESADADENNDGYISMNEAFLYAREHDRRVPDENPLRYEGYAGMGDALSLRGLEICTERLFSGTVASDETVDGCIVRLRSCTVKNDAKLTVEYKESVIIDRQFTMEAGAEFETKVTEE